MAQPVGAPAAAYGGFWIRFLALIVDSAILNAVNFMILGGAFYALGVTGLLPAVLLVVLIYLLYWPLMQASGRQATVGKALLGMKVTDASGGRISLLRSFGRELSKIISGMVLMIGYLMAGFSGRKRSLHDLIAGTYVVRDGVTRLVPALGVAVLGFALPPVAGAVLGAGASEQIMGALMAEVMGQPAKPAAPPAPVAKAQPKPAAPTPQPEPAQPIAAAAPAPAATPAPIPGASAVAVLPPQAPVQPTVRVAAAKPAAVKPAALPVDQALTKLDALEEKPRLSKAPALPQPTIATGGPFANPSFNDLMTAVLYKDNAGVDELIKLGKWPDKPDRRGLTPLMVAVMLGDARNAEALLQAGANPHLVAGTGDTAASLARGRRDGAMTTLLERYGAR